MTIALGVLCEEGAVLLTDSMSVETKLDGTKTGHINVRGKHLFGPRVAAVHSGFAPWEWPALSELAAGFDVAAGQLWDFVSSYEPGPSLPRQEGDVSHQLIVAGGPPGEAVRMVKLETDREPEYGPVLVAGVPAHEWRGDVSSGYWPEVEQLRAVRPSTLMAAFGLAVTVATTFIASLYREAGCESLEDFARRGLFPSAAWPLHVAIVDPFGINRTLVTDERGAVHAAAH